MYIINIYNPVEWDIWFAGDKFEPDGINKQGYSLKQWAARENADMVFNMAYFAMPTQANKNRGVAYHIVEYVKLHTLGEIGYGSYNSSRFTLPNGDSTSGWSVAIEKGILQKSLNTTNRRSRNMHGLLADGQYIHVQTSNGYTEREVALYVNDYVKRNYNTSIQILLIEDAGGSTGAYSNVSKLLFAPEKEGTDGRLVPSVVCVKRKITGGIKRTLQVGYKGDDVKLLQQVIGCLEIDGDFGNGTASIVKKAQANLGLTADGICGPVTLKALGLWNDAAQTPSTPTVGNGQILVNVNGKDYAVDGMNLNGTVYVGLRSFFTSTNTGTVTYQNNKPTITLK